MSIPSEDVLLNALNHEIRRDVLKLLKDGNKTYSQLLNYFTVPTGKLNYHLRLLEGLIEKDQDGLYQLTALGIRAWKVLENFRTEITDQERPLLRQAYLSQSNENQSFLYLMYVSRMNFKFYMLVLIGITITAIGIYYIATGGTSPLVIGEFILGFGLILGGIYWVRKVKKSAPGFISKMDRVLDHFDKEGK